MLFTYDDSFQWESLSIDQALEMDMNSATNVIIQIESVV